MINPELLSKPLTKDGIARMFYNTRKKILKYFKVNKIRDINIKRKILNLAMGSPTIFYSGTKSSKTMLELDIELYLHILGVILFNGEIIWLM